MSGICTLIRYSSSRSISGVVCPFLRTFPILIKHVLWIQVTMSSLVNALEGAGQWQLAISKFEELRARGIRPNVICYNAAISALAKGSQVCLLFHFSCCCPSRLVSGCSTWAGRAFETTRCLKRCVAFPSAWPPTLRCSAGGLNVHVCTAGGRCKSTGSHHATPGAKPRHLYVCASCGSSGRCWACGRGHAGVYASRACITHLQLADRLLHQIVEPSASVRLSLQACRLVFCSGRGFSRDHGRCSPLLYPP